MMAQSVMTQAVNLFGNAAGSVTSKGKQAGTGFDQIINQNLKAVQNAIGQPEAAVIKKTSAKDTDPKNSMQSDDTVKAENTGTDKAGNVTKNEIANEQTAVTEEVGTIEASENETEEPVISQQIIDQIAAMLQNVQEAVMNYLKISPEELNQLLSDQGMSLTDLLQPDNLQQLVLANSGKENILAVLTDENLADTMKQLLETVEEIKSDADLGLTGEQIKAILEKVEEQGKTQTEVPVKVTEQNDNSMKQNDTVNQKEAVNTTKSAEPEDKSSTKTDAEKGVESKTINSTDSKDTSLGASDDNTKKDHKELKAQDQFQTFVDNLVKVSQDTQVTFSGNLEQVTELRDIANQIVERIRVTITPEQTSMELHLNPENLGKVNLTVQSKNGLMTAQFVVQNEISKEAIESQLNTLREALNQQGIKIEAIEVTVSAYAFEQSGRDNSGEQAEEKSKHTGKQISLEDALSMTELPEEDVQREDITGIRGSQIDYTA